MNCEDLMKMKQIRSGMKLITGEAGMLRPIRWIYFADCVQCLSDDFNVAELIHGGELVIITNESLTGNDKIIELIRVLNEKEIAGIVVNEGQISNALINYCSEQTLPLFELSVKLHLIDLSQIVCKALVEEEINANSRERILSSIFFSEQINASEILEQANYLGVNLKGKYRVVALKVYHSKHNKTNDNSEGFFLEVREGLKKEVKNEFRSFGLQKVMVLLQNDTAAALIPAELFSRDLFITILTNIIRHIESSYHVTVKAGVGTSYEYIEDFKKSLKEAENALSIFKIIDENEKVFFYENLGIYSLIAQINNGRFLDEFVENHIGNLIKTDNLSEGELCETLETYLNCNCNANAAAETLFIHRNTMRYRLDKIKKILGSEINDMSACLELKLAFAIKHYRDNREED